MVTQSKLKELFYYRDDGNLVRLVPTGGPCGQIGRAIGSISNAGRNRMDKKYLITKINGQHYCVHKLIYMWHHGHMPEQVDHINRVSLDNRIENLREATACENASNRKVFTSNTSSAKGVSWHKFSSKWFVYINVNRKRINLGYFKDFELAELVASEARDKYHGSFAI